MRRIDLRDYEVTVQAQDPARPLETVNITGMYEVKNSILNLLFHPGMRLNGAALVRQHILAQKIEACDEEVMLEEEEYDRLKEAVDTWTSFGKTDVEFVLRILNAEQIKS